MRRSVPFKAASSWWATAAMLCMLCAAYAYFSFGDSPFLHWKQVFLHKAPGIVLFVALILNLAAATIRVVLKAMGTPAPEISAIRNMAASAAVASDNLSLDNTASLMRSWGFTPLPSGGGLVAVKGRYSFLPGTVFRAGVVLFLASLLLSAHLRQTHEAAFRENEERLLLGSRVAAEKIAANLPEDFFRVGEESGLSLKNVSAAVSISGNRHRITPFFPTNADGRYYRITHLGFVLPLALRSGNEETSTEAYLDVLPPGKTDAVALGSAVITLSLEPDRTITKGILKGEQFNLNAPVFRLAVKPAAGQATDVRMRPGETAAAGELAIRLGKTSTFVKMQAVRDPALPFIYVGLAISVAGLIAMLSRFFWYRKEAVAVEQDSQVFIGYTEEFFRKWGIQKFFRWLEKSGLAAEASVAEDQPPGSQQHSAQEGP